MSNIGICAFSGSTTVPHHFYTLSSLYSMLTFYAHRFFNICSTLATIRKHFPSKLNDEERAVVVSHLKEIRDHCQDVGLRMSIIQIDRVMDILEESPDSIPHVNLPERLHEISVRIQDELQLSLFMQIPPENEKFYTEPCREFGNETLNKFPSIVRDVEDAGKCYATGNGTAAVFHLMRIMEIGLRTLGKSLQDPNLDPSRNPNWETILRKCDDELKKPIAQRSELWRGDETFYCQATANLRSVKDAWRNPTMHVKQDYDQEQALSVFNTVKAFMKHIAQKLSE